MGSGSGIFVAYVGTFFEQVQTEDGKVFGIEIYPELAEEGLANIMADNPQLVESGRCSIMQGDGYQGLLSEAPFDLIHVGAAAPELPQALIQQLKPGGRIIIPTGHHQQHLMTFDKDESGTVTSAQHMGVRYVPLVHGEQVL